MIVHLAFLVGFRNKVIVFTNWIWNYFTFDRGIRLIIRPSPKDNDNMSKDMEKEMRESVN
jgi:NADH dehydrogenase